MFPCKSCLKATTYGCCGQLPVFNQSELAKVVFKYEDLIKEKELEIHHYNGDKHMLIVTPKLTKDEIKNGIALTDYPCPFLDKEKGCLIYEDRPFICSAYGESIGKCPFKGCKEVTKEMAPLIFESDKSFEIKTLKYLAAHYTKDKPIKELPVKKALKEISKKEFRHLLIALNGLVEVLNETDILNKDYKYTFIDRINGTFSPCCIILLKEGYPYSALQKPFNFLQRKLAVLDYSLLDPLEKKINNILKANQIEDEKDPYGKLLFSVMYLEYFKENFKRKNREYQSLINANELYALKKELFNKLGFSSFIEAYQDSHIAEINNRIERLYKGINSLK